MTSPSTATRLAVVALVAALLQLIMSVPLGLASLEALQRADQRGPSLTLWLVGGSGLVATIVYTLRRRPLVAATVFVGGQAALYWPLARRVVPLELTLHGEFVLHHFLALLAAGIALAAALPAARDRAMGRLGIGIALGVTLVTCVLMTGHLMPDQPAVTGWGTVGMVAVMALWAGLRLGRAVTRGPAIAALCLLIPMAVRLVLAGPANLTAMPVSPGVRPYFGALLGLVVVAVAVCLRRPASTALRTMVGIVVGIPLVTLYLDYSRDFGQLEPGLGPMLQSLLGFAPPYPEFVAQWLIVATALLAFIAGQTIVVGLVQGGQRHWGAGVGLVMLAGLGWSNAQLILLASAGLAVLLSGDEPHEPGRPPLEPLERLLPAVAETLGLQHAAAQASATAPLVIAIAGHRAAVGIELRGELDHGHQTLQLTVGETAQGSPDVQLLPMATGSHELRGDLRNLADHGRLLLEAIAPFPQATARLWPAGAAIDFGRDLHTLDRGNLVHLIETLVALATE